MADGSLVKSLRMQSHHLQKLIVYFYFLNLAPFVREILGIETRTLHILGKDSTTELCPWLSLDLPEPQVLHL